MGFVLPDGTAVGGGDTAGTSGGFVLPDGTPIGGSETATPQVSAHDLMVKLQMTPKQYLDAFGSNSHMQTGENGVVGKHTNFDLTPAEKTLAALSVYSNAGTFGLQNKISGMIDGGVGTGEALKQSLEESNPYIAAAAEGVGSTVPFLVGGTALRGIGAANKLATVNKVGKFLSADPAMQLVSGATAGIGGEWGKEKGVNPIVASLLGAYAPSAATGLISGSKAAARSIGDMFSSKAVESKAAPALLSQFEEQLGIKLGGSPNERYDQAAATLAALADKAKAATQPGFEQAKQAADVPLNSVLDVLQQEAKVNGGKLDGPLEAIRQRLMKMQPKTGPGTTWVGGEAPKPLMQKVRVADGAESTSHIATVPESGGAPTVKVTRERVVSPDGRVSYVDKTEGAGSAPTGNGASADREFDWTTGKFTSARRTTTGPTQFRTQEVPVTEVQPNGQLKTVMTEGVPGTRKSLGGGGEPQMVYDFRTGKTVAAPFSDTSEKSLRLFSKLGKLTQSQDAVMGRVATKARETLRSSLKGVMTDEEIASFTNAVDGYRNYMQTFVKTPKGRPSDIGQIIDSVDNAHSAMNATKVGGMILQNKNGITDRLLKIAKDDPTLHDFAKHAALGDILTRRSPVAWKTAVQRNYETLTKIYGENGAKFLQDVFRGEKGTIGEKLFTDNKVFAKAVRGIGLGWVFGGTIGKVIAAADNAYAIKTSVNKIAAQNLRTKLVDLVSGNSELRSQMLRPYSNEAMKTLTDTLKRSGLASSKVAGQQALTGIASQVTNEPKQPNQEKSSADDSRNHANNFSTSISNMNTDPQFVNAIAQIETGGVKDNKKDSVVSSAGAIGKYQMMPATFKEWAPKAGIENPDIKNPEHNRIAAEAYMGWLGDKLGNDPVKVAIAYNWGIGRLNTKLAQISSKTGKSKADITFADLKPYLPAETRNYVIKLAKIYEPARSLIA